jgi:uncharacterized small protein (TIGR04563 family)
MRGEVGYGRSTSSEVSGMGTDKRKQSLYFPESMLKSLQQEADRLDRSLSWIVQRCVKAGIPELRKLPSTDGSDGNGDADDGD